MSGNKDMLHKVQTNEDGKSGSNILQRRLQDASSLPQTTKCPTFESLSKDNVEYCKYFIVFMPYVVSRHWSCSCENVVLAGPSLAGG